MNLKKRALLREFQYILNPRLLIEDVINSAICRIALLPGAGSRVNYKHDYGPGWDEKLKGEEPEVKPDYKGDYWKNPKSPFSGDDEEAPVIPIKDIDKDAPGYTLQIAVFDQAKLSRGGTNTGSGEDAWMWLQKADGSRVDLETQIEGDIETHHAELGYEPLGSKPITFVISWLKELLGGMDYSIERENIRHPKFTRKKYAKGFDIKTFIYIDIFEEFKGGIGRALRDFDDLFRNSESPPWFGVANWVDIEDYKEKGAEAEQLEEFASMAGVWWVFGKVEELLAKDPEIYDVIKSKKDQEKREKEERETEKALSFLGKKSTGWGDVNTAGAYKAWNRAVAIITNILSKSGKVDSSKVSPHYVGMAIQGLLAERDPATFDVFDPENMSAAQADILFGDKKSRGALYHLMAEIQANPSALKLESVTNKVDSILAEANKLYESEAEPDLDMAIYTAVSQKDMNSDEIKRSMPAKERQKVDDALDRMEKFGFVDKRGNFYRANQESGYGEVNASL